MMGGLRVVVKARVSPAWKAGLVEGENLVLKR
jgi:hypothetical protein